MDMGIKNKIFPGGYRFRRFAGQPEPSLVDAGIPERVALPLRSPQGVDLASLIKAGSVVIAGQIIARDDKSGALLRATISGTVEELKPAPWLGGKTKVATLLSDGTADWVPLQGHSAQWNAMSREALRELINLSGAAALPEHVGDLLVEAVEAEAFNLAPEVLFEAWGVEAFAEGLAILARALPRCRIHLVLSRGSTALLSRIAAAVQGLGLKPALHTVSPKYPLADPRVLVPTILGREASSVTLVMHIQTVFQIREAVVLGKPLIERIVALGGTGFSRRPHLRLRIGTPVGAALAGYLRQDCEARLVLNSLIGGSAYTAPAMPLAGTASVLLAVPENKEGGFLSFANPGFTSDSHAVAFAANLLPLAKRADTNLHGEHRACISCGFCEEVCPARILPNILHRYVQKNVIDETLVRFQIFRCIDCNLCSYVCTSKIPLARLLAEGKERLRQEGLEPQEAGV
jgi:Na(+)-translocating NADH:ubiquinone oxidoreductase A subunit